MATRRKLAPSAEWVAEDSMTLSNGMEVMKWSRGDESRLVPVGMHPDDQPLSDAPRMALVPNDEGLDDEESPADRVASLLNHVSGDDRAYIAVYRMVKGKREWCTRYRPDEFEDGSFNLIRDNFGPGEFELRLYGTDPNTGKFAVRKSTRVQMAESQQKPIAESGLPTGLNQVLSTIAQGQQQMLQALVDIKQAPPKDPMEEMTKMLSMMTMMREAMGLNQMQAPQPAARSSISEIVEAIKELRGAAAEVMPEKEESNDLMGMLPKVLEMVQVGQAQQAQQAAQAPMMPPMYQGEGAGVLSPVTLPPAFAAQDAAQQSTEESDDMNPLKMLKLRAYLKTLIDHAERKTPAPEVARWVYDKLPDDLIDIMELPSWFEMLSMVAPDVKPHQEYLTTVRDAALALFAADDDGDESAA